MIQTMAERRHQCLCIIFQTMTIHTRLLLLLMLMVVLLLSRSIFIVRNTVMIENQSLTIRTTETDRNGMDGMVQNHLYATSNKINPLTKFLINSIT